MVRALTESRIRGVKTNIPFLLNVLNHDEFLKGTATTRFIEEHPELMIIPSRRNRANRVRRRFLYASAAVLLSTCLVLAPLFSHAHNRRMDAPHCSFPPSLCSSSTTSVT